MVQESKRHWQRLEQNAQKQQKVRHRRVSTVWVCSLSCIPDFSAGIDSCPGAAGLSPIISGCHSLLHCSLFISPTQAAAAAYLEEALGGWGAEGNASEEVAWAPWVEWVWEGWEVRREGGAPSTWKWNSCAVSAGEKDRSASLTRTWSTARPKRGTGEPSRFVLGLFFCSSRVYVSSLSLQLDEGTSGPACKIVWEEKVGRRSSTSFFTYLSTTIWREFLSTSTRLYTRPDFIFTLWQWERSKGCENNNFT